MRRALAASVSVLLAAVLASSQAVYQPAFKGDPARSAAEAAALGYMRTFLRAQKIYKKKNEHYATSLLDLAKTGSFTRRMAATDRGDYTVRFRSHKDKDTFELTMIPKHIGADHRSFFSNQDGPIRGDEQKEADERSEVVK